MEARRHEIHPHQAELMAGNGYQVWQQGNTPGGGMEESTVDVDAGELQAGLSESRAAASPGT